jgi:hypothetical protein
MAVRNCAWIRVDSISPFVYNLTVVNEDDYDWLRGIWGDFYPGDYILWQDDLMPSPGYYQPVNEQWRQEPSGTWKNPNAEPWFPPEE